MTNFLISAKAVHLKTYEPKDPNVAQAVGHHGFVRMIAADGRKFNASVANFDALFKIGCNKQALFELTDNPFDPEFTPVPTITNVFAE